MGAAGLTGVDLIDWPDDELRSEVSFIEAGAEDVEGLPEADRVMLVEVIEHVPAPWLALSRAARLVAPGGRIVVSTPNIATLRSRLELAVRGNLTSFRPDFRPHFTPALPHVTARVLEAEGLRVEPPRYAGADVDLLDGRSCLAFVGLPALSETHDDLGDRGRRAPSVAGAHAGATSSSGPSGAVCPPC